MFVGLTSSSENTGSRTETGLGLSGISMALSTSTNFLVANELEGDANGEDCSSLSSSESLIINKNDY